MLKKGIKPGQLQIDIAGGTTLLISDLRLNADFKQLSPISLLLPFTVISEL